MKKLNKKEALLVKKEALKHWFAQDGTMCLEYYEDQPLTSPTDNGGLFAVLLYWLFQRHNILDNDDRIRFTRMEAELQGKEPGTHHRNPGRAGRDEAHDNPRAYVSGAVLFGTPRITETIIAYGVRNGFIYENVDMDSDILDPHLIDRKKTWWYRLFGFDITRFRQGTVIAFYKLSIGWMPTLWHLAWMLISYIITAFQKVKDKYGVIRLNTDHHFLTWIELIAIDLKYTQMKEMNILPRWKSLFKFIFAIKFFWRFMLLRKTNQLGMEAILGGYFNPQKGPHPIEKLAYGIVY